jgi:hypothetical protein
MRREAWITWIERAVDLAALATGAVLWAEAPGVRVAITWPMLVVIAGAVLLAVGLVRDVARIALEGRPVAATPDRRPGELRLCLESTLGLGAVAGGLLWRAWSAGPPVTLPLGVLVLGLAAVAALGHLTRNVVVVFRQEPAHRNVVFWS